MKQCEGWEVGMATTCSTLAGLPLENRRPINGPPRELAYYWLRTTVWISVLLHCISDVAGVECYSCTYIPGVASESSCSDPWYWGRDKFNIFTGPQKKTCEIACVKTVIETPGEWSAVLRTCGELCEETRSRGTLTTCCDTDLCNDATSFSTSSPWQRWTLLWLPACFSAIFVQLWTSQ